MNQNTLQDFIASLENKHKQSEFSINQLQKDVSKLKNEHLNLLQNGGGKRKIKKTSKKSSKKMTPIKSSKKSLKKTQSIFAVSESDEISKSTKSKRTMPEKIVIRNKVVAAVQKIITKAGLKFNLSAINTIVKQYYNPDKNDPKFKDIAEKAIEKINSSSSKIISDYKNALANVPARAPRKSKKSSKKNNADVSDE